jgi:hypothetical protein
MTGSVSTFDAGVRICVREQYKAQLRVDTKVRKSDSLFGPLRLLFLLDVDELKRKKITLHFWGKVPAVPVVPAICWQVRYLVLVFG